MEVKQTESVAQVLGAQIQPVQVRRPEDFQSAYATMIKERARAVIIIQQASPELTEPNSWDSRPKIDWRQCATPQSGQTMAVS